MLLNNNDLFYDSIIQEWQENYGYKYATEEDVNMFFTDWFYQVDTEEELEILNRAEKYVRFRLNLD